MAQLSFKRIALFLLPLMALASGCATDRQIISQAADAHTELEPAVITDETLERYVQAIGDRVVEAAKELSDQGYGPKAHKSEETEWMFQDIQFHLVNSPTLNAFTTGGKHIYLYSELFRSSKTEDEFAAVVAHEFAHIYGRHVQKGTNRQYAILGSAAAAAVGGALIAGEDNYMTGAAVGGGMGLAAGQFLGLGFTRSDENEADEMGFDFYVRAGWDPEQFSGFFQTMIDKGHDKTPEIASSHPKLSERVKNAERRAAELPDNAKQLRRDNIASGARFEKLQDRAKKLAKDLPADKSLEAAQLMLAAFPSCVAPEPLPEQKEAQQKILNSMDESNAAETRSTSKKRKRD
ncbi:MAG TPA: M48 family metalloprotease [Tepidisphaeraceae bacterium]|jgi:predicted Zn-dependent protease